MNKLLVEIAKERFGNPSSQMVHFTESVEVNLILPKNPIWVKDIKNNPDRVGFWIPNWNTHHLILPLTYSIMICLT